MLHCNVLSSVYMFIANSVLLLYLFTWWNVIISSSAVTVIELLMVCTVIIITVHSQLSGITIKFEIPALSHAPILRMLNSFSASFALHPPQ